MVPFELNEWVIIESMLLLQTHWLSSNCSTFLRTCDLYVQAGLQPALTTYHCRPYLGSTNAETCPLTNSGAPPGSSESMVTGRVVHRQGTASGSGSGSQVTVGRLFG